MKKMLALALLLICGCGMIDFKKPSVTVTKPSVAIGQATNAPSPAAPENTTCDLSKPLCDPEPDRLTDAYMAANNESEECGQERGEGIVVRFRVWIPRHNCWWILSSVGSGHVRADEGGGLRCDDFIKDGYCYEIIGGREHSGGDDPNLAMDVKGNRHLPTVIYARCRKAQ